MTRLTPRIVSLCMLTDLGASFFSPFLGGCWQLNLWLCMCQRNALPVSDTPSPLAGRFEGKTAMCHLQQRESMPREVLTAICHLQQRESMLREVL